MNYENKDPSRTYVDDKNTQGKVNIFIILLLINYLQPYAPTALPWCVIGTGFLRHARRVYFQGDETLE